MPRLPGCVYHCGRWLGAKPRVTRPATRVHNLMSPDVNRNLNLNLLSNNPLYTSLFAMATKRSHSSLLDSSPAPPPKARAMTSRHLIDPYIVLQGLEQQNITSDEAVAWIKNLMNQAIAMPAPPEKKKIKSQKVSPSLCQSSYRLSNMGPGPVQFDAGHDRYSEPAQG